MRQFVRTLEQTKEASTPDRMSLQAFCEMAIDMKLDGRGRPFFDEWVRQSMEQAVT